MNPFQISEFTCWHQSVMLAIGKRIRRILRLEREGRVVTAFHRDGPAVRGDLLHIRRSDVLTGGIVGGGIGVGDS